MGQRVETAVRVHLVGLPQMLEDVVRDTLDHPEVELADGPPRGAAGTPPTIVVTAQDDADAAPWMALLRERPDVAILVIRQRDGQGALLELWPQRRSLGAMTAERIVAAARSVTPWHQRLPAREGD